MKALANLKVGVFSANVYKLKCGACFAVISENSKPFGEVQLLETEPAQVNTKVRKFLHYLLAESLAKDNGVCLNDFLEALKCD